MKTASCFLCALLLTGSALLAQNDVPTVDIATAKSGSRVSTNNFGNTRETQTNHILGVSGKIHFFHAPKDGYVVQCFFIAKSESTGGRYIFDIEQDKKSGQFAEFGFEAPPLTGTTQQWTVIPTGGNFSGTVRDDYGNTANVSGGYSGSVTQTSAVQGSKFEGWVTRIMIGDRVVRIDSNQPALSQLAKTNEKYFTATIAKLAGK